MIKPGKHPHYICVVTYFINVIFQITKEEARVKIHSWGDSLLDQLQLYTGKKTVKKKPPPFRQKFPIKTGVKTAEKER